MYKICICRSLDSPKSSSLEQITHPPSYYRGRERDSETPENPVRNSEPYNDSSFNRSILGWEGDSDIDVEQDPPDWTVEVPQEILNGLDRVEKKRQEVLNGTINFLFIYHIFLFFLVHRWK